MSFGRSADTMSITADSREKRPAILAAADERRLLSYEGPNGEPFSFDILVKCQDATEVKCELKQWGDYLQSWSSGKLERQMSATDLLIVECGFGDFDATDTLHVNGKKHLWLLSLSHPVIVTEDVQETIAAIRFLERREGGLKIRESRIKAALGDSPRDGVLRALLAGMGISPDRQVGTERLGDILARYVDWPALGAALHTDEWAGAQWGSRKPTPATLQKIAARVADA